MLNRLKHEERKRDMCLNLKNMKREEEILT
jgi:hypothetical protein